MNLLSLWVELDQDPEAFWRTTPRLMMAVIKGRTTGADRPAPRQKTGDEIMAIAKMWNAVVPPLESPEG